MFVWILVLAFVCCGADAWGPATQKYICHEAVKFVWGVDAVGECLPVRDPEFLTEFCESVYGVLGEEYEKKCLAAVGDGVEMHPAVVSDAVLGDSGNHLDFGGCPIHKGSAKWVCGDGSRPAYETAVKWFGEAESAPSLCMRVYDFCVGASYYADSESQLRQVRYVSNDCVGNIEESIDRSVEDGVADWSSNQLCVFNNQAKGSEHKFYQQRMGESSGTVNRIIANLTAIGAGIKSMPYRPGKGVVVLANSIDYGLASDFIKYLKEHEVNVVHSNASEFERLRYNQRVIILGGQNSPEGVGGVVDKVLSAEQEESLLQPGATKMFTSEGFWQTGQKVIVLAGFGADDTKTAWSNNKDKVLAAVKVISGG